MNNTVKVYLTNVSTMLSL